MLESLIAVLVYLIVPVIGFITFMWLVKQMKSRRIQNAPIDALLWIFGTYVGLLILTLASIIWPLSWSGLASLGAFYLVIVAPFIMGIIAFRLRKSISLTVYHKWTFITALIYLAIMPLILFTLYLIYIV